MKFIVISVCLCLAAAAAAEPVILGVTPNVLFVEVGASASFLVEISESAPPSGVTVLVSTTSWVVSAPGSVTILPGETQAQVPVLGIGEGDGEILFQLSESVFVRSVAVRMTLSDVMELAARTPALHQNTPNPFNPRTTIRFDLPAAGPVRLSVYDLTGRLVKVLVEGEIPAGSHEAVWDGRDASGRGMASGNYFARLEAGGRLQTVRMSLVR
jgi:hypothetical protein